LSQRYLLFSGAYYEAQGGWRDLDGAYESIDAAKIAHEAFKEDWAQIVDTQTMKVVLEYDTKEIYVPKYKRWGVWREIDAVEP